MHALEEQRIGCVPKAHLLACEGELGGVQRALWNENGSRANPSEYPRAVVRQYGHAMNFERTWLCMRTSVGIVSTEDRL